MDGQTIQHYRLLRRLAAGGMGVVYLAEDLRLGRQVALKFLPPDVRHDAVSRARLLREARAASALRSPHIAVTYDVGEHDGGLFIAMEYVDGTALTDRVAGGPLPVREAVDIGAQIAEALDEAHAHGIIHRDIKSANVLQTRRGLVKVLDFGLAKVMGDDEAAGGALEMTSPGMIVGTVAYMAPEQLRGAGVDHRVDLFSLGVVLFEMLSGRLPFAGQRFAEVSDRILREAPAALARFNYAVPPALEAIVRKALEKDPALRYQSARELNIDLRRVLRTLDGQAPPAEAPAEAGARSIAVLTFDNLTREPSDDWIGTGIAETVTTDLKSVHGLAVIARTQVAELQEAGRGSAAQQAVEVGRRLGTWWIVSGAFQRLGERVRITAQLVEVLTGSLIRTLKIDGRVDDIFALQDRIVFELSRSLEVTLDKSEVAAIERADTSSVEAFEAYSRGLVNLRSAGRDGIDRAIALFERAIERDSAYAPAWAALGGAYTLKGAFLSLPELQHKAMEYLERALALNPALANAHAWRGSALLALGRTEEGIEALRRAERLDPEDAAIHQSLARAFWMWRGQVPEGIQALRTAIALNPEAGYAYLQLSFLEALMGNLDAAEADARQAIELQEQAISGTEGLLIVGAHARLGYVHYLRGRHDEAHLEYRRELEHLTTSTHALRERTLIELHQKLSAVHEARGDAAQAARFGDLAIEAHARRVSGGADDPATRYYVAAVYARRGDVEATARHLELPRRQLPQFTRWRLPRDVDFQRVLSRLPD